MTGVQMVACVVSVPDKVASNVVWIPRRVALVQVKLS